MNNGDWTTVKKTSNSGFDLSTKNTEAERSAVDNSDGGKITKFFDFLITFSLGALFFGLPLFFSGITFQGLAFDKQMYFYFWIILALVFWTVKGVILGEMKIRRTPLDIPIVIFLFIYAVATFFSVDRWHSFWGFFGDPSRGLVSVLALVVAYYLMFSHLDSKKFNRIIGVLLVSGFLVSLWSFLSILGLKFLPANLANVAPLNLMGSTTGLGIFLSLLIPLIMSAIFKLTETAPGWKRNAGVIFLVGNLFFNFLVLFSIYSFVPWLGILVGVSFFLVYVLARIIRPVSGWTWIPMAGFTLVLTILMIGNVRIARVDLPVEVNPAPGLSFQIVKDSLKEKLFLGSGPGNFAYSFSLHKPQDFNLEALYNLRFYQGSGIIFESLPTVGILGTIGLLLIILTFFGVEIYLLTKEKEKNKIFSLGTVAASLILLVDAAIFRIEGPVLILGILMATLGLIILYKESAYEEKYLNLSLKASPKFALTLAFIFMVVISGVVFVFVFLGRIFVADVQAGLAVKKSQISETYSVDKILKAINLNKREGRYFSRLAQDYMYLVNQEVSKDENSRDLNKITSYLNFSISSAKIGQDLMVKDVTANEVLAQIYENAGVYVGDSLALAEEIYKKTAELDPHNPNFFLKLGQIKISSIASKKDEAEKKKLVEEAKDLFQKAIDEKNNFDPGYYNLALTKEALGDLGGAIDDVKKALTIKQGDLNYAFYLGRLYQARGEGEDNKMAEDIFKAILAVDKNQINVDFSLGMLYEKQNKNAEAIGEYEKVLTILPDTEGNKDTRAKIQKMISNVKNGIANTAENLKVDTGAAISPAPESQPVESSEPVPPVPAN
jgi:tetratricopeptide (TPR) repeat protein